MIHYQAIVQAKSGEQDCGDTYLVKELADSTFIAVIDGVGHGPEAAKAANLAKDILEAHAHEPLEEVFKICHQGLKHTRGAAISALHIHKDLSLNSLAVGNVSGSIASRKEASHPLVEVFFTCAGIVGYNRLPLLHISKKKFYPKDILIITTDGIKKYQLAPYLVSIQAIAETLFRQYRNPEDDALILVAQRVYEG